MKTRACLNPFVNDCKLCRIWKIRRWCSFFCFRAFSQVSSKKSIWIFDVNWLISQKFIRKDLKSVAFLVYNLEANKNRSEIPSKVLQSMKYGFPLTDRISTLNENFLNDKNKVDLVQILKKMVPRPFIEQWGLDHPWEKFMKNRFINYWPESTFSSWLKVLGVPQGSIGSTFSLNVFLNDLLLSIRKTEICNFADDSTLVVLESLQSDLDIVLKWFIDDQRMAKAAKFQFI